MDRDEYKRLLNKAEAYAAKAERSPQEVADKVRRWAREPMMDEELTELMTSLRSDRFVDEERYAERYTADKVRFLRKGPLLLRRELHQKGIPPRVAEAALAEVSEEVWVDALEQYLSAKLEGYRKKARSSYQLRAKLMQAGYARGFPAEITEQVLSRLDLYVATDEDDAEWY